LLPEDPDASAERLQKELVARLGLARLGVVVTDTFGRPWREGVVDVAIGCAGMPAVLDLRGTVDDHGTVLETTVVALADAVAAASGLVMTKTARVPAALVRGLDRAIGDAPPGAARDLVRAPADDLFRESVAVALASAGPSSAFGSGDVPRALLEDAMAAASPPLGAAMCSFVAVDSTAGRRRLLAIAKDPDDALRTAPVLIVPCVGTALDTSEPATLLTAGAAIGSLLVALHAQGLAWSWDPGRVVDPDRVRAALTLDPERRPIGVVAVGPRPEGGA
jgi:coenzyme F420-0:L-glutamate ligase/coenzyme F420-1:gamma-L-glutamate ligase